MPMTDDDSEEADYTEADIAAERALAQRINTLIDGQECAVILMALSQVMGSVLATVAEDDPSDGRLCFAGAVLNMHSIFADGRKHKPIVMTGETASQITPEQAAAATRLCEPLGDLIIGLCGHFDTHNVLNAWLSALLNLLLVGGVENAQAILRTTADQLPETAAQIDAAQAFEGRATTSEVGRA